jgi:hypothetical protein
MQVNDTAPQPVRELEDRYRSPEEKAKWDAVDARAIAQVQDWLREKQERRENRTVIPIKLQVKYWFASAFFVACAQLFTLALYVKAPFLWFVFGLASALWLPKRLNDWLIVKLYWYLLMTTGAGAMVQPIVYLLSPSLPTYRQLLLVHWCFNYFIISEMQWHQYLSGYMRHPIHRDTSPAGYLPANVPNVKIFSVWTARFALTHVISCVLAVGLTWIGDVPDSRPMSTYWCANKLFNSGWMGQLFQTLVLLRPHRHFTAWLVDSTWTLGETLWHRVHSYFSADKNVNLE